MVGRLAAYKGHRVLLQAMASLKHSDHPIGISAVILGSGELESRLRQDILRLDLESQVRLLTDVGTEELHAHYDACDLLCLPSLDRAEAFGLVLLEAMAHARPVVASDLQRSGVSWVVEHGETGWLFPVGDSAALAKRLQYCAENPDKLAATGRCAKAHVQQRFSPERVLDALLAVYEELCAPSD